jgi:RimJ/RimL family protein N-acetyltransferase
VTTKVVEAGMIELETARLRLRPWRADDLDAYGRLLADPAVVRSISSGRPLPRQRVEAFCADFLVQWQELGFGPFAAILKAGGEWVGQVGLNRLAEWPDVHKVEVGFELLRPYWRQGLATEAAIASLRFGFQTHRLERIISVANPANLASRRVMKKAGLTYRGVRSYRGHETVWYAIDRVTWQASASAE